MITENKLIKGSPEEIVEYITTQPNYTSAFGGKLDIKEQLDKIGLEKISMVFYLEKRSDTEMALVSIYVHIIDVVEREKNNKKFLESSSTLNNKTVE